MQILRKFKNNRDSTVILLIFFIARELLILFLNF